MPVDIVMVPVPLLLKVSMRGEVAGVAWVAVGNFVGVAVEVVVEVENKSVGVEHKGNSSYQYHLYPCSSFSCPSSRNHFLPITPLKVPQ